MLISKNDYLKGFGIIVVILALVRCVFPSVTRSIEEESRQTIVIEKDTIGKTAKSSEQKASVEETPIMRPDVKKKDAGNHPVVGVRVYREAFPDSNEVQLVAALEHGVSPVADRDEAEHRKAELVYVAANPFYYVDKLSRSIPYLVPRAAVLINDIGRNYLDSLLVKGIPLHQVIVTSVTRTQDDLAKLSKVNKNASENSCHLYGTTFDISYNRFIAVSSLSGLPGTEVRSDQLKKVLAEVLRDLREQERCYVKYEIKQGCFHITVR